MASSKGTGPGRASEWVGGILPFPGLVTEDGETFRPAVLVWLSEEGLIVGSSLGRSEELLAQAAENLRKTIASPAAGPALAPKRLRVASEDLASALRGRIDPWIQIVIASTPELAEVAEAFAQSAARVGFDDDDLTYFHAGVTKDMLAAFFQAASAFFRAAPWKRVPADEPLVVRIEALEVRDGAVSVIGQLGESFGFLLFPGLGAFDAFNAAGSARQRGEDVPVPAHMALSFDRGADVPPALRKEIAHHGFEVAGPKAYPGAMIVDEALVTYPPTPRQLAILEALARALPPIVGNGRALRAAFEAGEPWGGSARVPTHEGEVEVALRLSADDE